MARTGTGTFNRIHNWVDERDAGNFIDATKMDAEFDGMATALTESIAKDGQTDPTANLPMGGYRHTGVDDGVDADDYASLSQAQGSAHQLLSSVSGTDTITAVATPALTAYAAGQTFRFVAAGANTGAVTLNLHSLGAKDVTKNGATALVAGDIASGSLVDVSYDGTRFQVVSLRQPVDLTVSGDASVGGDLTLTGALIGSDDIRLGDNDKIELGALSGGDLQIYHDASNSAIVNKTAGLFIRSDTLQLQSDTGSEPYLAAVANGAVTLYHDNAEKAATYTNGLDVTGVSRASTGLAVVTGGNTIFYADEAGGYGRIELGGSSGAYIDFKNPSSEDTDARIIWDGTNFKVTCTETGAQIFLRAGGVDRLETTTGGVLVTGDLSLVDNDKFLVGTSSDGQFYHNGTNTVINNATGALSLQSDTINFRDTANTKYQLNAVESGAVTLYHNGSAKAATATGGLSVTGTITLSDASTRGDLLATDASGDMAAVAVGSAGQHLVSDGTDPAWASGGWEFVNQYTASADALIEIYHNGIEPTSGTDFVDGYTYRIEAEGYYNSVDVETIGFQAYVGAAYVTSSSYARYYVGAGASDGSTATGGGDTGTSGYALITPGNTTTNIGHSSMTIKDAAHATRLLSAYSDGYSKHGSGWSNYHLGATVSGVVKHIKIYPLSGATITAGTFTLYRRKDT